MEIFSRQMNATGAHSSPKEARNALPWWVCRQGLHLQVAQVAQKKGPEAHRSGLRIT